ncbi:MAG TPA: hypothetical protein GX733_07720 [Tissierellia bacterium]|nr:hypothetical protein [Tissierellia bacterium]
MEKSSPITTNSNPSPAAKPRFRIVFVILGLLIVGLILLLVYRYLMPEKEEVTDATMSLVTLETYKLSRGTSDSLDNIFAKDDRLLYFHEGELIYQDLSGRTLWKKQFSENILLDKHQSTIMVIEKKRGNIYLLDEEGNLRASILGRKSIASGNLLADGSVLVFYSDNRSAQLFENDLYPASIIEVENATITSADYSLKNNLLAVLALREVRGDLESVLLLYTLEGLFLNEVSLSDLVLGAYLWDNGIVLVYRDGLQPMDLSLRRDGDRHPLNRVVSVRKQDRSLFVTSGSSNPLEGSGQMQLIRYSLTGKSEEFSVKIRENYDNIYSRSGLILAYYKNVLDIYNSSGELLLSETFNFPIKKANLLDEENLAVFDGERFMIMKIQY